MKFPSPAWDKISPGAIDFIKRLLDKDPERRPSAAEALEDPWITHESVNPFKRIWHGTFLAKSEDRTIEHADTSRRDAFIKMRSQRNLMKKQKFNLKGSLKSYLRGEFDSNRSKY